MRFIQYTRFFRPFSGVIAAICLLTIAPSDSWGSPQRDMSEPISSHECSERLRAFGASDAAIQRAMPAIEAYIDEVLHQSPTPTLPAFLPSPLAIEDATELHNRTAHELAECDAADDRLTNGILSVMQSGSDQRAAERFRRWVELRRDKLFFRAARLAIGPLDFSILEVLSKRDGDGSLRIRFESQLDAHEVLIAQLSRTARTALLETPIRTARLARDRTIAAHPNPPMNLEPIASERVAENEEWKRSVEQVRTDGLKPTSAAFRRIGDEQRAILEQIGQSASQQIGWELEMNLYEHAYPKPAWDRRGVEEAAKALRNARGVAPESLAALSAFEREWRADCSQRLAEAARRFDDYGWNPPLNPIEFAKPQENGLAVKLTERTKVFQDQINALTAKNQPAKAEATAVTLKLTDEEMRSMMVVTFGALCETNPITLGELSTILDAVDATTEQRLLAVVVRHDSSEADMRMNDQLSNRWDEIGAHTVMSWGTPMAPPPRAAFEEIARIRREQHETNRSNSERFFLQLSSVIPTASEESALESYRHAHLRMIERQCIECLIEQIQGFQIEPLWRIDLEMIAHATNHIETNERNGAVFWAIIHSRNQELLQAMRALSDEMLELLAANQLMSTSQRNDSAARCRDASKRITKIQNAKLAEIMTALPTKDVGAFVDLYRRTAYPSLAKFLGVGDQWISDALTLAEGDEPREQKIIALASAYGAASDTLFHSAVDQQTILDANDVHARSASEALQRTFFARQEMDLALQRDLQRALGAE